MRGPIQKFSSVFFPNHPQQWMSFWKSQYYYLQDLGAPYRKPLTYQMLEGTSSDPSCNASSSWAFYDMQVSWCPKAKTAEWNQVVSRCANKFANTVRSQASIGVDIAQGRQTWAMMTNRMVQLVRALKACARLDSKALARTLQVRHIKKKGLEPVSGANLWLEYYFGWKPLLMDIYEGAQILSSPFPGLKVKVSSGLTTTYKYFSRDKYGYAWTRDETWHFRVRAGCTVRVINQNLALADRLGLINPATIIWEAVPWSFVVDWFIPIGDFVNSWTGFPGLELNDKYTTYGSRFKGLQFRDYMDNGVITLLQKADVTGIKVDRRLNEYLTPKLYIKPHKQWQPQRFATALSLAIQQTTRLKPK